MPHIKVLYTSVRVDEVGFKNFNVVNMYEVYHNCLECCAVYSGNWRSGYTASHRGRQYS